MFVWARRRRRGAQVGRPPVGASGAASNMEETSSAATLLAQHKVPIIDIAHITKDLVCPVKSCTRQAAIKLQKALSDSGYAFIVNHGITENKLQAAYCKFDTLCSLPEEAKSKNITTGENKSGSNHYKFPGHKVVGKLHEYKHVYHISDLNTEKLPESDVPGFTKAVSSLTDDLKSLASVILQFIAIGCDLEPSFFLKHHAYLLSSEDESHIEMVHYPPMDDCKPHNESTSMDYFDSGTFSIISQDSEIGLEVLHNKTWVPIGCLPGALLLSAGMCLEKWTHGVFKPTRYRWTVPNDVNALSRSRHSIQLHVHPQKETEFEPLNIITYEFHAFCPNQPKRYCSLRRAYRYIQRRLRQLCR